MDQECGQWVWLTSWSLAGAQQPGSPHSDWGEDGKATQLWRPSPELTGCVVGLSSDPCRVARLESSLEPAESLLGAPVGCSVSF